MCDSNDDCDVQAEVQMVDIFSQIPDSHVPLTKADLRKARAILQAINSGSSDEGSDRK
jgi:hypothetical protein